MDTLLVDYVSLLNNAKTVEERVQISVAAYQDWISHQCHANYNARFAWRWRSDFW